MAHPQSTPLPRAAQRIAGVKSLLPVFAHLLTLGILLLAGALFMRGVPLQTRSDFSLGGVGAPMTQGFNLAETTENGRGFRWTKGDATLRLPPQSSAAHTLRISLSAPRPEGPGTPVPATLSFNDQIILQTNLTDIPRRYAFLVPEGDIRFGNNTLRIQSPTFRPIEVNRNERQLGVAVFEVDWRALGPTPWLLPTQLALIAIATLLFYALLVAHRIPFWPRLLLVVLFVAILLAMRHSDTRFLYRWNAIVATAGISVVLALALALSVYPRVAPSQLLPLRTWIGQHWPAFVGYLAVTSVMLFPLLLNFTTHTLGPPGDNWEYMWKMQWFSDALIKQNVSPVFAPQIFFPGGSDLTVSEIAPAHNLINLPITYIFGFKISYNFSIFASFVLTAFFTYLLARRLGANPGAAWVAGLVFAFCVRRYYHVVGHFGMTSSQWLPLLLYGWEGLLTRRRAWDGYVAGLGYVLSAWCTLIYGTTVPFFVIIYTIVRVGIRNLPSLRQSWRPMLLMAAISIAMVVPLAQPYFELQQQGGSFRHTYIQVILNAIPPQAYLFPNPFHPLWGQWANQFYPVDGGEHYASVGYTTLALTLAGLWIGRRRRDIQALAVVMLIFVILSFGPELRFSETSSLMLPAKFLYDYVPVFSSIRTWGRMIIYVMICAGVLAAVALSALPRSRYRVGWLLAATLILVESASVMPMNQLQPRLVDRWLRDQPGNGGVVHMPHEYGGPREYYTLLFSGKPASQGHGKFPPSAYREGKNIYDRFPDDSSLRLMQRWQTDYIVVDEVAMDQIRPNWRAKLAALPLVTRVYQEGGFSVYRLRR